VDSAAASAANVASGNTAGSTAATPREEVATTGPQATLMTANAAPSVSSTAGSSITSTAAPSAIGTPVKPVVPNGFAGVPISPFEEQLPDLPLELMDDPLAVASPPPGMVVPPPTPVAAPTPSPPRSGSVLPPLLSSAAITTQAPNLSPPVTAAQAVPVTTPTQAAPLAPTPAISSASGSAAATAATASAAAAAAAAATPAMDRDFIARNQIVERYLSGRLPLKGATDFERFCKDNPKVLDELGLPERVNAGLRLLEASGKPEPWQEKSQRAWTKPQFVLALVGVVLLLGVGLAVVASDDSAKGQRIAKLEKQSTERPLDPATNTRIIRLVPSHEAASNTPAVVIGGGPAQLVDFKIDETRSAYKTFRITIDRIDQGRVAVLHNLVKDSNGHLRIALNSSALGPGNYQLTIEGLSWRGDPEPDSWVTIGIQR
jgi:hypothetical protein